MSNYQTEFDILGCTIRIKSDENNDKAMEAIQLLTSEIDKVRSQNPTLKHSDLAVLSALNLATKCLDKETEFKENIFALKESVQGALKYVEEVSPGSMQIHN